VTTFKDAVAQTQPLFSGAREEAYITHVDRLQEAEHVEPCVMRAVHGELDPSGHRALGRLTSFSPPGLAEYLVGNGRYVPGDEAAANAIADATRCVLALGWLFCCTPQAQVAVDRSARDIWDFWAGPSLRDRLDQIVPKDLARLVHDRGADMLVAKLAEAGLKPRGLSSKPRQMGYQIVQHGFYLRMTQTDEIREDAFRAAVAGRRESGIGSADSRWDWDAYPTSNADT
jgi:hypothetical protein